MSDHVRQTARGARRLRIALLADTHLEPETGGVAPRSNRRTRAAVGWMRALAPDLVVHLGDVVHPLPGRAEQDAAFAAVQAILAPLAPRLLVAPGNHDLGDKPNTAMPAPAARGEWCSHWARRFPLWQAHRAAGFRILLACASLLGSGEADEEAQWTWLEQELAAAAAARERSLLVTHYPPFILDPEEPGHYDNLDPGPRARLLSLVRRHGTEAILSGHAHAFFLNRVGATRLHVVPSVAFARRDYAEFSRVAPAAEEEFGRNETARLGFAVLDLLEHGHVLHPVMTEGTEDPAPPPNAFDGLSAHPALGRPPLLGVPLHHPWTEVVSLPTNPPTAPFRRRRARDDRTVQLLLRLGCGRVRIPCDDLEDPAARARVELLAQEGVRIWLCTAGIPDEALLQLIVQHAALLEGWEIVLREAEVAQTGARLLSQPARLLPPHRVLAPLLTSAARADASAAALFVAAGLPAGEPSHILAAAPQGAFTGWLSRIGPGEAPAPAIRRLASQAAALGQAASVTVSLAPARPDEACTDDAAIAARVAEAAEAAARHPGVMVWTDTLLDVDRGYFVRHGLADRRMRPRAAGLALLAAQARLGPAPLAGAAPAG